MKKVFVTTRRNRSWWKRILIGLLLAAVTIAIGRFILYEMDKARGKRELAAAIAETDSLDPRWRWDQIEEDRPQVPDERNSIRIIHEFGRSQRNLDNAAALKLDDKDTPNDTPPNQRLTDERVKALRAGLAGFGERVALARSLKEYPAGRATIEIADNPLDTKLGHAQICRTAAHVLNHDVELRLADGAPREAFENVRATLHAGAALRGEATLISQLVRLAIRSVAIAEMERILGIASLPVEVLKQAQEHLSAEEREELVRTGIRGERAMFNILYQHLKDGRMRLRQLSGGSVRDESWDEFLGFEMYRSRLDEDHATFLRWMNQLSSILELPVWEQRPLLQGFEKHFLTASVDAREQKRNFLGYLLFPAVNKVADAEHRNRAKLRCTIAALAAERFRITKGHWPDRLEELVPDCLAVASNYPGALFLHDSCR